MAITIPNTFTPLTVALSAEVNENFQEVANQAVAKSGDTMTGTLVVPNLTVSGTTTSSTITVALATAVSAVITSTSASALDVAGGINAGSGNVGIVGTDGKIPAISSTYFASLDGSALTGISGADSDNSIIAGQVFG